MLNKISETSTSAESSKPSGYRWVIIGSTWIHTQMILLLPLGVLLPAMRKDLGFGLLQAGWLGSASQLAVALTIIPSSLVLVKLSPKWVYGSFLFLVGVILLATGFVQSYLSLSIAIVLFTVVNSSLQIPLTLLRLQWIPRREFATVMGFSMGLSNTGQSAGTILVPVLLGLIGNWRQVYIVTGMAVLVLACFWALTGKEHPTSGYLSAVTRGGGWSSLKKVFKRKEYFLLGLAQWSTAITWTTFILFLPSYLTESRGFSLSMAGLIVGGLSVGGILATVTMGYLSDQIGLRKPTIIPSGVLLPFLYFLLLSPLSWQALLATAVVVGFVAWSPFPALQSIPFELPDTSPSDIAMGQSVMRTVVTLGILGGPLLTGIVATLSGSLKAGLLALIFFPVLMTIVAFTLPETGTRARAKTRA
ncbi:MAG: MFS transporter [Dehalococcoidia bacterium]|nr:MFS transporter [Dehalococcoidia bacterium]